MGQKVWKIPQTTDRHRRLLQAQFTRQRCDQICIFSHFGGLKKKKTAFIQLCEMSNSDVVPCQACRWRWKLSCSDTLYVRTSSYYVLVKLEAFFAGDISAERWGSFIFWEKITWKQIFCLALKALSCKIGLRWRSLVDHKKHIQWLLHSPSGSKWCKTQSLQEFLQENIQFSQQELHLLSLLWLPPVC